MSLTDSKSLCKGFMAAYGIAMSHLTYRTLVTGEQVPYHPCSVGLWIYRG